MEDYKLTKKEICEICGKEFEYCSVLPLVERICGDCYIKKNKNNKKEKLELLD